MFLYDFYNFYDPVVTSVSLRNSKNHKHSKTFLRIENRSIIKGVMTKNKYL